MCSTFLSRSLTARLRCCKALFSSASCSSRAVVAWNATCLIERCREKMHSQMTNTLFQTDRCACSFKQLLLASTAARIWSSRRSSPAWYSCCFCVRSSWKSPLRRCCNCWIDECCVAILERSSAGSFCSFVSRFRSPRTATSFIWRWLLSSLQRRRRRSRIPIYSSSIS